MKLRSVFVILCCVWLVGCSKGPVEHERVDIGDAKKIVYMRNFHIMRHFSTENIPTYQNKIINYTVPWREKVEIQTFYSLLKEGSAVGIKVTKLPNFNFIDLMFEQIIYDEEKKEAVITFTLNFAGKFKSFHIIRKNEGDRLSRNDVFKLLFQDAAKEMIKFVKANWK